MLSIIKQVVCLSTAMFLSMGYTTVAVVFAQGASPGKAVPAERVVIRFQQDGEQAELFEVLSRKKIAKVLPPSDELPTVESGVSGFYYELQSADGNVLYRRIIGNPILIVVEGYGNPLDVVETTALKRKEVIPQEREFTLLIPRAAPGDQLVIFSSPLQSFKGASITSQDEPSEEVARLTVIPSTPK